MLVRPGLKVGRLFVLLSVAFSGGRTTRFANRWCAVAAVVTMPIAERLAKANHAGGQCNKSQSLETLLTWSPKKQRFLMVSNELARMLFSSPLLSLGQKNQRFLSVSNVSSLVLWSSPPPTVGQTKQGCVMIPMALHGARAAPTSNPASHKSLSLDCVCCH